ncbi:MAG: flavin reductase [Thermoprotei archaeon ex4572_64]|nr:MAG: flavin reductase [Thermoprotei archaeon ex4572_64]
MSEYVVPEKFYLILHPRPVYFLVTVSSEGRINVMAISWTMPVSEDEKIIALAIDREHFTRKLLSEVDEFTLNVPTIDLLSEIWKAGTLTGWKVDKSKVLKLTFKASRRVKPPIVSECIAHIEGKVSEVISVGEVDLVLAKVLEAYVRKEYLYGKSWDVRKARIPLHLLGRIFTYSEKILVSEEKEVKKD